MNRKEFAEYIFALPSYEEQLYISKLLEVQDARITGEEAQLNKLQQIKQGLMHDLLTGQVHVTALSDRGESLSLR